LQRAVVAGLHGRGQPVSIEGLTRLLRQRSQQAELVAGERQRAVAQCAHQPQGVEHERAAFDPREGG
jgi:hypothetical protein